MNTLRKSEHIADEHTTVNKIEHCLDMVEDKGNSRVTNQFIELIETEEKRQLLSEMYNNGLCSTLLLSSFSDWMMW